jgi:hypothetical protein
VKAIYTDIHADAELVPGALIRDGDASISAAKRDVCEQLHIENKEDHACVVHINRNLPNRIWELYTKKKFSTDFANSKACPTSYNLDEKWNTSKKYQTYKKHVMDAVRRRSAAEFALAQTEAVSLERTQCLARAGVSTCSQGDCLVKSLCFEGVIRH